MTNWHHIISHILVNIDEGNEWPASHEAIIWSNADLLTTELFGTKFSENVKQNKTFLLSNGIGKYRLQMAVILLRSERVNSSPPSAAYASMN